MPQKVEDLTKLLTELPGPSGAEQAVRDSIARLVKPCCDRLAVDPMGNLVAQCGSGPYKVGFLAHMDEVGMIVKGVSDRGLISFEKVGSIDDRLLLAREVDVVGQDGATHRGVIASKSQHLQTAEDLSKGVFARELWIDVGARNREEVIESGIDVGSGVVFATKFSPLSNGRVLAKALDDRLGCAVLVRVLEEMRGKCDGLTVYGMFTVQEEIGAKGASVAAFRSSPDLLVCLDTVPVGNQSSLGPHDIRLGKGPVIRLFDWHPATKMGMVTHPEVRSRLVKAASERDIPYQVDVLFSTYLDSATAHLAGPGTPGGSVCLPRQGAHSPTEIACTGDAAGAVGLLTQFLEDLIKAPIVFTREL